MGGNHESADASKQRSNVDPPQEAASQVTASAVSRLSHYEEEIGENEKLAVESKYRSRVIPRVQAAAQIAASAVPRVLHDEEEIGGEFVCKWSTEEATCRRPQQGAGQFTVVTISQAPVHEEWLSCWWCHAGTCCQFLLPKILLRR